MNRQLSSFDIFIIAKELRELQGSYIDKIYQLSKNEILIRFRNIKNKKRENIFIRNGEFIALTDKNISTPQRPTVFAMTLRKYLQNGIIEDVIQYEFDRILKIIISKKEGKYKLVIEFFSDGNIILVDPDDKIIFPLIRQAWAHRKLKGREEYSPPPSQINPFELTFEKFKELIKQSNKDIVRTLAVNINLSGFIAEEICLRANISKEIKIENINDTDLEAVYASLNEFLEFIKNGDFNPIYVKKNNEIVDLLPFKFKTYKNFEFEKVNKFTRAFEEFIKDKKKEKKEIKKESKTDTTLGKLNRQINQQKNSIEKFKKNISKKKKEGDIIYLHYQEVENILNEISKALDLKEKKEEIKKINKKGIVKEFDPKRNLLILYLNDIKKNYYDIKIDFRKSVSENAEKAYAENKKLKNKLRGAEEAIKKTKENINKVKNKQKKEIELRQNEEKIKKTKKEKTFWFEKYRWFISSSGNIVVAGKDAKTNDIVVKKYLKDKDRYAHADISGAPSVVIKSKDVFDKKKEISENTLKEACIFAASYSKAWKQFAEAEAYWVNPEQVSKTAQSGEFVPKGAFIIRGKRNYYRSKLEIGLGEITIDGVKKIMGGPVSALKKHSKKYLILNPGPTTKNEISKKLAKIFNTSSESISKELPPGGATITDSYGIEV